MKKLFLIVSLIYVGMSISAQSVDDVTLVVSGDGTTKEEAIHVALRSAVEQAYGVFVSANTEIFNDEVIKDEIATVTSGNVKSFKELSCILLPNGNQMVTLQTVVSTKKLAAYAQSKGASCEFAGATFGANLKLIKLNQENTKKAYNNLYRQCIALAPYLFDVELVVEEPTASGDLVCLITLYSTPNLWEFSNMIVSALDALRISDIQATDLQQMQVDIYNIWIGARSLDTRSISGNTASYLEYGDNFEHIRNNYINRPLFQGGKSLSQEVKFEGWFLDAYDSQPMRGDNYYYAPFPADLFAQCLVNACEGYYISDNLGNKYDLTVAELLVDRNTDIDVATSCYCFFSNYISLPYAYIIPYQDKETKEIVYPRKEIGKKEILLNIPIETLIQISNFEIKRDS